MNEKLKKIGPAEVKPGDLVRIVDSPIGRPQEYLINQFRVASVRSFSDDGDECFDFYGDSISYCWEIDPRWITELYLVEIDENTTENSI